MRSVLCLLIPLLALASGAQWRFARNVSEADIAALTDKNCYFGSYGAGLTITNCTEFSGHLVEARDGLHMCVVDLVQGIGAYAVRDVLQADGSHEIVFDGQTELVLGGQGNYPVLCHRSDWPVGQDVVHNVITVPVTPYVPRELRAAPTTCDSRDSRVADLISSISAAQIKQWVTDISNTQVYTRNSNSGTAAGTSSTGFDAAKVFVRNAYQAAGFSVSYFTYDDFPNSPCVVADYWADASTKPVAWVVMGAHLDSRAALVNSGTQRAPGADDDGTGTAALLEAARVIGAARPTFKYGIRLISFSGEEQGLKGSRAIAKAMKTQGYQVVGMFNADMLGYTQPGKQPTIGFMDKSMSSSLTSFAKKCSELYVPNLGIGTTSACCSDQQAFYENGYEACGYFETPTSSVAYPEYHKETDAVDNPNINWNQCELITKSVVAAVLSAAELR